MAIHLSQEHIKSLICDSTKKLNLVFAMLKLLLLAALLSAGSALQGDGWLRMKGGLQQGEIDAQLWKLFEQASLIRHRILICAFWMASLSGASP